MSKDLFSEQSDLYARYRPGYPQTLFDYVLGFVRNREMAWDCATGNGQAALVLASYFKQVEATDISEAQLSQATQKDNIHYQVSPAEQTPFPNDHFDLITVATAYHWLNWKEFYREAVRVGKSDAVVAVWGYNRPYTSDEKVNQLFNHFYKEIIHPYWDPARRHVDENYADVEFEFIHLPSKSFIMQYQWTRQAFLGYIETWSAVQSYRKKHHSSPLLLVEEDFRKIWDDQIVKEVTFPLFMKIGRIAK